MVCISVKYLTSRWTARAPEYELICAAYIRATERDYSGWNKHQQKCKGDSGASEGWWGGPWSRKYKLSTEYSSQYNQQRIGIRVSWWSSQAAQSASHSPMNRWLCSRPQGFNSRPARNKVSGAPDLGHLLLHEEMRLGCWYARSTGGGWNGSWKDFHLSCSGNAFQIGDLESCQGVATVHLMGEYPWRLSDFCAKRLSQHSR